MGFRVEKGALTTAGSDGLQQVTDPVAVKLLAFIHDSAFAEDGLNGFGAGGEGATPSRPAIRTSGSSRTFWKTARCGYPR